MEWLKVIATFFLGVLITLFIKRIETARNLLKEGMDISALPEAWILDGPGNKNLELSKKKGILIHKPSTYDNEGVWLQKVEVRTVLDAAEWNSPEGQAQYYDFIEGRRTWIVRNQVLSNRFSYTGVSEDYHQALLSSRGMEELCAWIERVAEEWSKCMLSIHGLEILKPILKAISGEDRITIFGDRISPKARRFLEYYQQGKFNREIDRLLYRI